MTDLSLTLGSAGSAGTAAKSAARVRAVSIIALVGTVGILIAPFLKWVAGRSAFEENLPWLFGGSDLAQQTGGSFGSAWLIFGLGVIAFLLTSLLARARSIAGTPLIVLGLIVMAFSWGTRYRFDNQFSKVSVDPTIGSGSMILLGSGLVLAVAGLMAKIVSPGMAPAIGGPVTLETLSGDRERLDREAAIRWTLLAAGLVSVLISGGLIAMLAFKTWPFVTNVEWASLWDLGWFPRRFIFDVKTLLVATLLTTLVAMVVAQPIGLAVAVYLAEYARPGVRRWLKPTIEVLAGIPTVVFGAFAFNWISPNLVQRFFSANQGNLLAAGIGVGVLLIPLVASISEDALASVPKSLREASAGLGARKATTTIKVVLPAAVSGLVAAFIIAISRGFGETMVVFLAGGAADTAVYTHNPLDGSLTMTAAMASLAVGTDNVAVQGDAAYNVIDSLYFVGSALFIVTLSLNMIANRFVAKIREQY